MPGLRAIKLHSGCPAKIGGKMKQNRSFKGVWIPAKIWLDRELTLNEKAYLTEIDSLDNKKGCFAQNAYFADFFGVTEKQASRVINSLVKKKYIYSTIINKEGNNAKRTLRIASPKMGGEPPQDGGGGTPNNAEYNNTVNNTVNTSEDEKTPSDTNPPEKEKIADRSIYSFSKEEVEEHLGINKSLREHEKSDLGIRLYWWFFFTQFKKKLLPADYVSSKKLCNQFQSEIVKKIIPYYDEGVVRGVIEFSKKDDFWKLNFTHMRMFESVRKAMIKEQEEDSE
jgi:hypothetical protein